MSSFISAAQKFTSKRQGENGSVEYSWSHDIDEKIVQLFFQLVRHEDHSSIEKVYGELIDECAGPESEYKEQLTMLIKLIIQTRDVVEGKGEYKLAYTLLWSLYEFYPDMVTKLLDTFVFLENKNENGEIEEVHPFGSFKDLKYFAEFVRQKVGRKDHPLIKQVIEMFEKYICSDWIKYQEGKFDELTLVGKWAPREKSNKFGWIFNKIARLVFANYYRSATTNKSLNAADRKAKRQLRTRLSQLNNKIDTSQIKMCGKNWSSIDFGKVTSLTMVKQGNAFRNKDKKGKTKHLTSWDRKQCATNLENHLKKVTEGKAKVNAKRANVYELVKMVHRGQAHDHSGDALANALWEENSKVNEGLGNVVSVIDTSASMHCDEYTPFYNAIGLGLRASEKAKEPFKNKFITFASEPRWVELNPNLSFSEKARVTFNAPWGGSTDFEKTMDLILNICLENELPPEELEDMVLAVFSDMQFNQASTMCGSEGLKNTMFDNMRLKFANAGLASKHRRPYPLPHMLFWNLRKTEGFPTLSTDNNVTMLSGYSSVLLNEFSQKGMEAIREYTPYKMLKSILQNERYGMVDEMVSGIVI